MMNDVEFRAYYADSEWCSEHVRLRGNRNNFYGSTHGVGVAPGLTPPLTPGELWDAYWPNTVLQRICDETNRYARTVLPSPLPHATPSVLPTENPTSLDITDLNTTIGSSDVVAREEGMEEADDGVVVPPRQRKTKGGSMWKDLTIVELRAWIGILVYMDIKKEPARRHY
jgi:hypothetical protein